MSNPNIPNELELKEANELLAAENTFRRMFARQIQIGLASSFPAMRQTAAKYAALLGLAAAPPKPERRPRRRRLVPQDLPGLAQVPAKAPAADADLPGQQHLPGVETSTQVPA